MDLLAFVVPSLLRLLAPSSVAKFAHGFVTIGTESYVGLPLPAFLAYAGLRMWRQRLARLAVLMSVVLMLLSMGSHLKVGGNVTALPLPWIVFERLLLLRYVYPGRLSVSLCLSLGLLIVLLLDRLAKVPAKARRLLGILAVLAALVPLFPRWPYTATSLTIPVFFIPGAAVDQIPSGSVALVAPFANLKNSRAMLWQAASGMSFRMPEGYGYVPLPPEAQTWLLHSPVVEP